MRSIRIWQWHWQSSEENVLEKTGRMLQKRMESIKTKKNPASSQHKNPCKLQANMLKPLNFLRENSMIFEMKINSFALAKTTFFQKNSKRRRGFSPDGLFMYPENLHGSHESPVFCLVSLFLFVTQTYFEPIFESVYSS